MDEVNKQLIIAAIYEEIVKFYEHDTKDSYIKSFVNDEKKRRIYKLAENIFNKLAA